MEYVIIIGAIVFLIIYLLAKDSKKETKIEQYGEAVSELTQMVADKISSTAYSITEPVDKKKLRLAKERLASRHGRLYRFDYYSRIQYLEQLLSVDDSFKSDLDYLGLSEDRWKKLALMIFNIGTIRKLSRKSSDYSMKIDKHSREYMLSNWTSDSILKGHIEALKNALKFFNIGIEEWVEYGDTVVEMHDLSSNPDFKEFGNITSIMPMQNNMHLL